MKFSLSDLSQCIHVGGGTVNEYRDDFNVPFSLFHSSKDMRLQQTLTAESYGNKNTNLRNKCHLFFSPTKCSLSIVKCTCMPNAR